MREIKGGGRITVCRPAHDRQSSSEDLPEPVSDRPPGRVKQHARPRETHDASHLFPHGRPVTMNGTAAATRFRFAENASVQPVVRIPDQGGAFGARYRISLLFLQYRPTMYSTVRFSRSIRERDGFFRSTGIWVVFSIRRESPVSIFLAIAKIRAILNILSGGRKGLSKLYPYLTRLRKDSLIVLSEQSFL